MPAQRFKPGAKRPVTTLAAPYLQVSVDAKRALEVFSDEMREALALGQFMPWAGQHGLLDSSGALKKTFPIPVSAAGYSEFKGDIKFRSLFHRSMSMKSKEWHDGVEVPARELVDFTSWTEQPAAMAYEWMRHPNVLVMAMLEANPLLDFYRDPDSNTASARALFAHDHPANVFDSSIGTIDNDANTTVADILSGKFFDDAEEYFSTIKGPNGKFMGLSMTGGNCLVPPHRAALFKKALELDTIIRAVDTSGGVGNASSNIAAVTQQNQWKNTVGWTKTDESTQSSIFYAVAAPKPGLFPWVVLTDGSPEERVWDESSEKYKDHGKVAIAYIGNANVAACLPHRIRRYTITG